ncbi:hypothetical protein K469DRAFT_360877 [Zopfia rhizophila CBS 207.26]|uniref:Uncharacterized protein n=1 Tax=Zopfia rhizophila CBS 207.26 TaxID=1314779 RepID=A0A6A6EJV1_9PEZI|nr:hypothetical protein K469DRAFT_360877 [Zopfia rhizophila CBS 207.26]
MARMLGRSRSLRMLKGSHKQIHQQDTETSQNGLDRLKAATPVTRADSRVETPDLLQRPKTSGGPGDRGKLFHKKVAPAAPSSEEQNFNFPFPSPTKSTTVLYAAEIHEDRDGVIGIALGSPTMASHRNTTPQATDYVTNNHGTVTYISSHNSPSDPIESKQEAPKPKISRWKSIFGKRIPTPHQQQTPFYQLQQSVSPARVDSHHEEESLDSRTISREDSRSGSPATFRPETFKPEIRSSRKTNVGERQPSAETPRAGTLTLNVTGQPKASLLRSSSSPIPPPKDSWNSSPKIPRVVVSDNSKNNSPRTNGEKPLLDVDIPRIEMERYSVMFGSLLQPNNHSSSLLVRRQGTSEKLKPLNELSMKKEENVSRNGILKPQRRATSPTFPKSPTVSLSLFPAPAGGRDSKAPSPRVASVHRPRPLQRSRTAPASSPNRQSFPLSRSSDGAKEPPRDQKPPGDEDSGMKTQLLTPTPSSSRSFDSNSEEVTIVVARAPSPWKPRLDEPEWEIVSKPSQNPVSQTQPSQPSPQTQASPQIHPSSAPLESRVDNTTKTQIIEAAPRSADTAPQTGPKTTVGVARQISVSRANGFTRKELLKPVLVKTATDSSERLVDKKPLTPTLVELKNRKSQRVQLVDA